MDSPEPTDPNRFAQELFTPLPGRYDRLAELLSMGQNGRWRRAMVDHIVPPHPRLVLDVASGPAGVALQLADRTTAQVVGIDVTAGHAAPGPAQRGRPGEDWTGGAGGRTGRADALRRWHLRRPDLHLSLALRRGPAGHTQGARPRGEARRHCGEPRVPPTPESVLAILVVGLHPVAAPDGGLVAGGRAWFHVGRFLGPNISAHYRRYPVEWTEEAWRRAGFVGVGVQRMSLGGGLVMWGRRAGG